MAWDKDLPDGDLDIAQCDDDIRANNTALETAMSVEHRFATGGNQSGRHVFQSGGSAAIALLTNNATGSIAFRDDVRSNFCLYYYNGSAYVPVMSGDPYLPYTNEQSQFTACQVAQWQEVTPTPGTPDTLAINTAGSPLKWATIVGDTIISNPIGTLSGYGTIVTLELIMDGTGGYTITFGSNYRAVGGVVGISTTASTKTLLSLVRDKDGLWVVSTLPNYVAIT